MWVLLARGSGTGNWTELTASCWVRGGPGTKRARSVQDRVHTAVSSVILVSVSGPALAWAGTGVGNVWPQAGEGRKINTS